MSMNNFTQMYKYTLETYNPFLEEYSKHIGFVFAETQSAAESKVRIKYGCTDLDEEGFQENHKAKIELAETDILELSVR